MIFFVQTFASMCFLAGSPVFTFSPLFHYNSVTYMPSLCDHWLWYWLVIIVYGIGILKITALNLALHLNQCCNLILLPDGYMQC